MDKIEICKYCQAENFGDGNFCMNCGAQLREFAKTITSSEEIIPNEIKSEPQMALPVQGEQEEPKPKGVIVRSWEKHMEKYIFFTIVLITLSVGIWSVGGTNNFLTIISEKLGFASEKIQNDITPPQVLTVKGGVNSEYPAITYGEAFDSFFAYPKWRYFEAEGNEQIVEFTGNCTWMETEVKAKMQFQIEEDGDSFHVVYFDFNDIPQSDLVLFGALRAIFENY